MSPEDIERIVSKISWGGKYIEAKDDFGKSHIVILKSPNAKDKNFIEFVHSQAIKEMHDNNVITKIELIHELKHRNLWTEKDDEAIKELRETIKALQEQIGETNSRRNKKRLEKNVEQIKNALREKVGKKSGLFNSAAEVYADNIKSLCVVFASAYNENEERIWTKWSDFLNENRIFFVNDILYEIYSFGVTSVKDIRAIARSPQWRYKWSGAKNIGDLFGKSIMDFDVEQQNLLYWSQFYDSVYEAYERPSQEIIDDDEALDEWLKEKDKEKKAKNLEKGDKVGKIKVSSNVMRHGEVFVVANPDMNPDTRYRQQAPDTPSIEEVANLNDALTQEFKKKELDKIKEKGMIQEKDLRHRRNRIARKLIGSKAAILNRNNMSGHAKGRDKKILPGENIS